MGCNMKFKTKRLKLIHHYKMEPNCNTEKISLIKLIKKFKEFLQYLIKDRNIDINTDAAMYNSLKKAYSECEDKLIDTDYFYSLLGKNFEDACVDDIKVNEILSGVQKKQNENSNAEI